MNSVIVSAKSDLNGELGLRQMVPPLHVGPDHQAQAATGQPTRQLPSSESAIPEPSGKAGAVAKPTRAAPGTVAGEAEPRHDGAPLLGHNEWGETIRSAGQSKRRDLGEYWN